jgi:uncharacterized RDD family membrane protein YckC
MDTPITNQSNPYAPPKAAVEDFADPPAKLEQADRLQRFGASMIDGVVFGGVVLPVILMTGVWSYGHSVQSLGGRGTLNPGVFAAAVLIACLIGIVAWSWITIVLVKRNGQSIAKWLMGIKVVRKDGSPASLGRIFWMRNVVNGLPTLIPIVGNLYNLVDHLFIFGETQQCLHDRIADTMVVKL